MKNSVFLFLFFAFFTSILTSFAQNTPSNLYPQDSIVSRYHNNWTQGHYRKRIQDFKNDPLKPNEIVFIGNSITEKGKDWSAKFGIEHIRNRGISGDLTDGVLKRLDEIIYFKPKAVFILIGVNDLYNIHHDIDNRHSLKYDKIVPSTHYVAKNIFKITKKLHRKLPQTKIFVRTVLPTQRAYLKEDIVAVNQFIREYEKKGTYKVIDLYAHFVDENNMLPKEFTVDGVHLSDKGYAHWVAFEKDILGSLK